MYIMTAEEMVALKAYQDSFFFDHDNSNNLEVDDFEVNDDDVIKRRLDDKKSAPHKPGTSCYRKGYHKYEKDWKKSTRRNRRHGDKAELRKMPKISEDALKQWAMDEVFHESEGWRREAYGVFITPNYRFKTIGDMTVVGYRLDVYAEDYDPRIDFEDFDVYKDVEDDTVYIYITVDEAINLGLVE